MYIPTIGLEIHAELRTKTKMFCACPNNSDEREPNKSTCPICLGHPGTLPVANEDAIKKVLKVGLALGGTLATRSHFDRKSYFYPDLPKGYQISQYEEPLVTGGMLKGVRITRIHLEEDTARLLHDDKENVSLVDFNRAGTPLMELVTEPDVKNADEAVAFARELQRILRYVGASDADMERGHMRVEANISIAKEGEGYGTKVEVKNLNSFKAVQGAIEYELERQEKLLKEGKKVKQETRGWNDKTGMTESQRSKESAHDYRYFPEPDLPPLDLSVWDIETLKRELPELPEARRARFVAEFGLAPEQVEFFVDEPAHADFFEAAASEFRARCPKGAYSLLVNYFTSDFQGLLKEKGTALADVRVSPEHFAHLVALVDEEKLSSYRAKGLLRKMLESGNNPEVILTQEGFEQDSGMVLKFLMEEINALIKENQHLVETSEEINVLIGKSLQKANEKKIDISPEKIKLFIEANVSYAPKLESRRDTAEKSDMLSGDLPLSVSVTSPTEGRIQLPISKRESKSTNIENVPSNSDTEDVDF